MKDRGKVLRLLMRGLKTSNERKVYLEGLGTEYEQLKNNPNLFIDQRDYRIYSTLRLNGQIWLGENLAYNSGEGAYSYDNTLDCLEQYGRLYTWDAAQKACPNGWKLPSINDFKTLAKNAGGYYFTKEQQEIGDEILGYRMLTKSSGNGFEMKLGGYRHPEEHFVGIGSAGVLWSSSAGQDFDKWHMWLEYEESIALEEVSPSFAFSVRCIQE